METSDTVCRTCKQKQVSAGKAPRKLYALPTEIVSKPSPDGELIFANRATPIYVCEVCDGDVIRTASNWALKDE